MTAPLQNLLDRVQDAGAKLSVNGDKLRVETTAPMPPELVEELRQAKPALLRHLNRWDATDWLTFREERAAIMQFDAGLPDAESRAFECCISEWLIRNPPPPSGPGACLHYSGTYHRIPTQPPVAQPHLVSQSWQGAQEAARSRLPRRNLRVEMLSLRRAASA